MDHEKVYAMDFARVYPLLVNKVTRKGHTAQEVDEIIQWLTGYTPADIHHAVQASVSYGAFFQTGMMPVAFPTK